jgi:hypothetical protein
MLKYLHQVQYVFENVDDIVIMTGDPCFDTSFIKRNRSI